MAASSQTTEQGDGDLGAYKGEPVRLVLKDGTEHVGFVTNESRRQGTLQWTLSLREGGETTVSWADVESFDQADVLDSVFDCALCEAMLSTCAQHGGGA